MQRPAAQPRHVGVERLAGERVPEGAAAVAVLAHPAAVHQLGHAVGARRVGHEHQVERGPGDGGGVGGGAPVLRQLDGGEQHRVADGLGDRHLALPAHLEPRGPWTRRPTRQRPRELLGEERHALRAVVEGPRERRGRRVAEDGLGEGGGLVGPEGPDRQLGEPPPPAQLVAQAAHRVVARQPVGAVRAEHERRHVRERLRDPRHQLEGGVVAPVQVVEHQQQRAVGGRGASTPRTASASAGGWGSAGGGPSSGSTIARWSRSRRPRPRRRGRCAAGRAAPARAGRTATRPRRPPAPQDGQAGPGREVVGEPGLADAGLAGEQDHAARAAARALEGLVEPPLLGVAADQGGAGAHGGEPSPPAAADATAGGRGLRPSPQPGPAGR